MVDIIKKLEYWATLEARGLTSINGRIIRILIREWLSEEQRMIWVEESPSYLRSYTAWLFSCGSIKDVLRFYRAFERFVVVDLRCGLIACMFKERITLFINSFLDQLASKDITTPKIIYSDPLLDDLVERAQIWGQI